jgi:hypothetical protein
LKDDKILLIWMNGIRLLLKEGILSNLIILSFDYLKNERRKMTSKNDIKI